MSSRVWIVIVNYRTAELVVDCLRSLSPQVEALDGGRVVVVDNASGDGSVTRINSAIQQEHWGSWTVVISGDRNGGFAFGNNIGIRSALNAALPPRYVMLLNPDTIAHPDAIRRLVDFMDARPDAGIAGSLIENVDGAAEGSAHNFPSPTSEFVLGLRFGPITRLLSKFAVSPPLQNKAHECDWVSGASMIIRRELLDMIGPMDEGFFLYFEEVDYCRRGKLAGWSVWYVPESRVQHIEGAATGIRTSRRRPAYWYDSRRRFFTKHYGSGGLLLSDALWATGRGVWLLRYALSPWKWGKILDPKWLMVDLLGGDMRSALSGDLRKVPRVRAKVGE